MFTNHHDIGGWNMIFMLGSLFVAVVMLSSLPSKLTFADKLQFIFNETASRMQAGVALFSLGVAMRIGGWHPWRSYLLNGDKAGADWYRDLSWIWTSSGALLATAGMAMFLWHIFGRWSLLAAPVFYVIGALMVELISWLI